MKMRGNGPIEIENPITLHFNTPETNSVYLNIHGELLNLDTPKVMGILNVTPDSFHDGNRYYSEENIGRRIDEMITEGVDIIDVGGCSTRPGSGAPDKEEEWRRVETALRIIKDRGADLPVSIDTYRAGVARRGVEKYGASIINDISGGTLDKEMWKTAVDLKVAYVLTHTRSTPKDMLRHTGYDDVTAEVLRDLSKKVNELRSAGLNDIIIDPGIGFAKTLEQNFQLLRELEEFVKTGLPVLVGLSRKSMISEITGKDEDSTLWGTISLNTVALMKGAHILRVHDVRAATETIKIMKALKAKI